MRMTFTRGVVNVIILSLKNIINVMWLRFSHGLIYTPHHNSSGGYRSRLSVPAELFEKVLLN